MFRSTISHYAQRSRSHSGTLLQSFSSLLLRLRRICESSPIAM
jgi:hypothetical protein